MAVKSWKMRLKEAQGSAGLPRVYFSTLPGSTSGQDIYDDEDGGVTRGDAKFRKLFKEAGLRIVKVEIQKGMSPANAEKLFPVKMYGLKPEALEPEIEQ
ncbi:Alpha N-terminal protein methyltransferase 1 like [Verticillium longisporum]|nr:Alpha N-terminal protein methyltransferase 1 like [Verticillium longisporum]KAG7146795.1 Alpha N-terminal protein methyltransferase 1 like [Verticillium longisporum]